ncbi:hypothetical protein BDR05DRAFT_953321 [Suillus weaverae]|nr:hypothetical protein BDR05DRAFT_953321 [Suillus weaverae]
MSLLDLTHFIQCEHLLKDDIFQPQPHTEPVTIAPEVTLPSVTTFLSRSFNISVDAVDYLWKIVKDLVWTLPNAAEEQAEEAAFMIHGHPLGLKMLRYDTPVQIRRSSLTLNHVRGKTCTYYGGILSHIQVAEHQFVELELIMIHGQEELLHAWYCLEHQNLESVCTMEGCSQAVTSDPKTGKLWKACNDPIHVKMEAANTESSHSGKSRTQCNKIAKLNDTMDSSMHDPTNEVKSIPLQDIDEWYEHEIATGAVHLVQASVTMSTGVSDLTLNESSNRDNSAPVCSCKDAPVKLKAVFVNNAQTMNSSLYSHGHHQWMRDNVPP